MPWHLDKNGNLTCTCCHGAGLVPCPVDHFVQPPNDEDDEGPFFMCGTCDFVVPPNGETDGKVHCPECDNGEREDTYDGPCDFCGKKNRTASDHTFPAHLHTLARERFRRITLRTCPNCFHRYQQELEDEYAPIADRKAFNELHQHKPVGTCDSCGQIEHLDIPGPDWYICVRCAPAWTPPDREQPAAGTDDPGCVADTPPPGWYEDPEHAGFVRMWNGTDWVGHPARPEHLLT